MNNLTVCGNASEPKIRYTQSGQAVASFAVFIKRKNKDGEQESTPINVTAWGDMAENIVANVQKGDRVLVTGRLQENTWTDKEGNERKGVELIADEAGVSLRWARVS
jgi:single-strand DNA-binding protein